MRHKRSDIFHQILERAKEAREAGIRPTPWLQGVMGLSRQQASRYLTDLCSRGMLHRYGIGRGVYYTYSVNRHVLAASDLSLPLVSGLPSLSSPMARAETWLHALLSNADRHSTGRGVRYTLAEEDGRLILEVSDDGLGVFQHILEAFRCNSLVEAAADLLKGARVVSPQSTLGLASLLWQVDFATVEANGLKLTLVGKSRDWSLQHTTVRSGTKVILEWEALDANTPEDPPRGGRVLLPVRLFAPSGRLLDRRDAKRMLRYVVDTAFVIVDFRGVHGVAASFLDQVFVRFKTSHSHCSLLPINLNASIRTMLILTERKK